MDLRVQVARLLKYWSRLFLSLVADVTLRLVRSFIVCLGCTIIEPDIEDKEIKLRISPASGGPLRRENCSQRVTS